mmetsp:Transcript_37442/g.38124  ORF Transcript_37442/g.38124 Transcript_37442/m.38124 type:complete len:220 (+) Transcript_37442:125-784(+)|eukprot:CAMPEP_0182423848 /NCGR_PEP_ID=MMETSP1167-20130531/9926_1 /TAXON_ID=2988 /ORGANISM="Mallomonas Sp, Strain CCMP3275" /LENGTH=219 /DNA_ID=CAMNT_0024603157 /DNA_START=104 /DNA_END=763 /DNA_ORIENTATION=-
MDDTPRSNFATPRDDRFYTPRNNNSSSDEWITPRANVNNGFTTSSDAEYDTPRGRLASQESKYDQFVNTERFYKSASYRGKSGVESKVRDDRDGDEVDTVAVNIAQGISSADVEDIFSYARHGRAEDIERLFDRGVPVNVRDSYGNTILTIASQNGNKRIAKIALRRGADINARNFKGNTPLHYCAHYGYGETLGRYLIEKGADQYLRNNEGRTCWDGI